MIYKAFAAATLVLALLVGLMADRLIPSRAPVESHAASAPAPVVGEASPYASAPAMEENIAPAQAAPAEMPAFGQPLPGSDTPSLSPGNGLPESSTPTVPQNEEAAEGIDAETAG